ncbi:uncharacterized protein LOC131046699 [Cryptomeria japonica]|uniref:uncharacterized protein LOC131046699 n=1 Tax=Cryptomeria japonica TaxID=3369 RepID=UPI0025AD58A6|nr:uncharacterized protein LOC131046699 [Cryptomeria japonica]
MCGMQSDFQSFVNSNALFEVVAKGGNFTWTNKQRGFSNIAEKLDRFFLTRDWNLAPLVFEAEVLAISRSDHFPVSLVVQKDEVPLRCPFKVENMWLRELGFRDCVVGWWKEALVVEVNGSPQGFFSTSRGIRQGNPISPFLFILLAKVLGWLIARKRAQGMCKGIEISRAVESTTHSQFANDTCLFGVASMHEASVMKNVLDIFSWATGHEINWLKSEIFFFHTEFGSQKAISRLFGIKIGQLLAKFLSMPLFSRAGKSDIKKGLLDGCKAKMEGWKSNWLSLASRLLMLKTVVSAMPIFPMAWFKLPGSIIKNMQQKMRKFLWNGNQDHDKISLMAWDRVCKPKGGGGAGLRDWRIINEAMGAKLVWQMYSKPKQRWIQILQAKYLDSGEKERILSVEDPLGSSAFWNVLKDPRELNLGEADEQLLRKIMENREFSCLREEDEIVWCGGKSGSYFVKVGFSLLEFEGKMKEWEVKVCWNDVCLPKVGAFIWLASNRRILLGDCLKKMGFAGPFRCVLYEKAEEDVDHLLLNCDFAQEAWCSGL